MNVPKYVQISIKKYLYHKKIIKKHSKIIKQFIDENSIEKNISLESLIDEHLFQKKNKVIDGQMTIFDFINFKI